MISVNRKGFRLQENDYFSYRMLWRMYLPVLMESLLVILIGIVDTLMASYLSDEATAGVSYVISITNWLNITQASSLVISSFAL